MSSAARTTNPHWRSVPLLAVFLGLASAASAGGFRISPTIGDVGPNQRFASFKVHNPGAEPLTLQISGHDWRQSNGVDQLQASDRLLVVPPLVTISPRADQIIRVALRADRPSHELAFRLHMLEVLPPPPPGFVGVRTAVRVNLPLFFAPSIARDELQWQAALDSDGEIRLTAINSGTRHARLQGINVRDETGQLLTEQQGPIYILPAQSRSWALPATPVPEPSRLLIQTADGARQMEHSVVVRPY